MGVAQVDQSNEIKHLGHFFGPTILSLKILLGTCLTYSHSRVAHWLLQVTIRQIVQQIKEEMNKKITQRSELWDKAVQRLYPAYPTNS